MPKQKKKKKKTTKKEKKSVKKFNELKDHSRMETVLQNFTTQPNSGKVTPAKLTDDTISIIEYITNDNRMITTTTILCIVLLLFIRTVQATVFWFVHDAGYSSAQVCWGKGTWLGTTMRKTIQFEFIMTEENMKTMNESMNQTKWPNEKMINKTKVEKKKNEN